MNNIILCGFMGCGKSTVGRTVARKMGRRFLDMDRYIETKAGKTIPEIFDEVGEEGFRDLEHEACAELAQMSNIIIASGGVSSLEDIRALKDAGIYGAILGKAYYTGAVDLREALEAAR